jgi:signal transduction histidine kinase
MRSQVHRLLRLASLGVWAVLIASILLPSPEGGGHLTPFKTEAWIGLWLAFGAGLAAATSPRAASPLRTAALAAQTAAALAMSAIRPDAYVSFLLVIIAWQAAVFFPLRIAATWIMAQAVVLFFLLSPVWSTSCGWTTSVTYLAFQACGVAAAIVLSKVWARELDQARAQAQMEAASALLVERSRAGERLRISQDLHDAVGHRLTVLSLNLEVASNTADPKVGAQHVAKALEGAKGIMAEVREVVGALRKIDAPDIGLALEKLAAQTGPLQVHVACAPGLQLNDPERAHALISCVREVITNALKHAGARNLWITVSVDGDRLVVEARDDGRGVRPDRAASGFGLSGMGARLATLGGGLEVFGARGDGFALRAWLPMPPIPSA